MNRNRRFLLAFGLMSCGATVLSLPTFAQVGSFEPVTYELEAGSTILDDCVNCDRRPIERPLTGTMVLRRLPVRIVGELYSITSIDFSVPPSKPDDGIQYLVKGTGSLHRIGDDLLPQNLSLDVEVNGTAGIQLSGKVDKAVSPWPGIDIASMESVDPARDPLHVFSIHIVAAPKAVQGVLYELVQSDPGQFNGSIFIDDCKICGRPTIPLPIEGTFLLRQVSGGPDGNPVSTYKVEGIDFQTTREGFSYKLSGDGEYTQGGEVAVLQSMDLTVAVNDEQGVILSSGGKVPFPDGVSFPDIDIGLEHQNPKSQVHVYSLHVVARPAKPAPEPVFRRGDANGDGSGDISDAVFLLLWRFSGGPAPDCLEAADVDGDGVHNLTDPVYYLLYLFQGGPAPPAPGGEACGPAKTLLFGCESSPCGV